jgi:hypothetical protein
LTKAWNKSAFDATLRRLRYWQSVLADAERESKPSQGREAAQFVKEYRKLVDEMLAAKDKPR